MKKYVGFLVVALLGIVLLVGCQPKTVEVIKEVEVPVEVVKEVEKEVEVPVEVEVDTKTLTFTSRIFSPPREQEYFINEIIKPFEEEHGVTINFQILDDNAQFDRATIQNETGHVTTDIIAIHNGNMPDWHGTGYVADLTDVVAGWTDRTFSESFNSDMAWGGKQYFVPIAADVYLLLANNKALDYVPDGVDLDKITWEQYADWAVAIAEGEGEGKVCITGIPMKSWVYQFGGSALSYGAGFPDINSAEAATAWAIWEKIGKADGFVPSVLNVENCVDPMMREESWLTVFHNARAGQVYDSNPTQFTLAPAPMGDTGIGSIAGATGFGIMEGAPNYELAVQFLEYLTRPDVLVKISKGTGGFIPPVTEARDFLGEEALDEVINKAVLVLEQGVVSGVPGSLYQDWGKVKECYDDIFADVILTGGDVTQEIMDEGQACVDGLLN